MGEFLSANQFFFVTLSVLAYAIGMFIQKKGKVAVLNPLLIGSLLVIGILNLLDIPNSVYQDGCRVLNYLMTPATICLSIAFYEQLESMKKHVGSILIGLVAGSICCLGSLYLLCRISGFERVLTMSILPKSITTAIGMPISEALGGVGAITSACIVVTGIFTNMAGPTMCRLFRLRDPIAQGAAFGTAGHVMGTAKAIELGELTGAVSSFALTCTGIFTCVVLSLAAQYI